MRTRIITSLFALAGLAAIALATLPARANGVFPTAGQIVIDPADPAHVIVRTTYGVLTTRAAGEPWDWICESAVGYANMFHPAMAVTGDGTVIAGLTDGLALAHGDTCAWSRAAGPIDGAYVVDVSIDKGTPAHAIAVSSNGVAGTARFWTSNDNAVTWAQAGADLPDGFIPVSIDTAPSDPLRVYVSGLAGGAGTFKGALVVSSDRGKTWSQLTVPGSDGGHAPYIGAVDPTAADRVYLRTDGSPGRLLRFDRATDTFSEIFVGEGFLRGFALSLDGATMLVGGSSDGIWRAPSATLAFEKVSAVTTRCLTWTAAGVYTCATEFADGFTVGLSHDEGASFDAVMHLACVRGPLDCAPETSAGAACPAAWPAVAMQIGQESCAPAATTSGSGGAEASGSSSATGSTGIGGTGGGGGTAATTIASGGATATSSAGGGGSSDPAPAPGGCACGVARERDRTDLRGGLAGLAFALLLFRRGRHRATPRA